MSETLTVCVCLQLNNMLLKLHQPPVVHKRQTRSVRSYSLVCFVSMQYEKKKYCVCPKKFIRVYIQYVHVSRVSGIDVSLALTCL